MTEQDVFTIVEMIDSMNRGRFAPAMIDNGKYRNVGVLWAQELEDAEAEISTLAVAALFNATASYENPRPITIKDFNEAVKKIVTDRRMATPALPEAEFVRDMPVWVKGWVFARYRGDTRVWPEQHDGYDQLQMENLSTRAHVWADQEIMPEADRGIYEKKAASMTAVHFDAVYKAVLAGKS